MDGKNTALDQHIFFCIMIDGKIFSFYHYIIIFSLYTDTICCIFKDSFIILNIKFFLSDCCKDKCPLGNIFMKMQFFKLTRFFIFHIKYYEKIILNIPKGCFENIDPNTPKQPILFMIWFSIYNTKCPVNLF